MQLTNAVVGAILAAEAMAAPHAHGMKRGSSISSRALKFGASKVGGGDQAFGGGEGSWGFGQGGDSGSFGPSATASAPSASTPTGTSSTPSKASSSGVASVDNSASSTESSSSTGTSTNSAVSSSSSFSSLTTMSNTQWAGAGYSGLYNSGETLQGVSATFNVLDASVPTDADTGLSTYYASAWIGIDGQESCTEITDAGLWQAGVDSMLDSSGTQSFYAWYEWYPADTVVIDIGTISAGDIISLNLTASSGTEGSIAIENTSTGESFSKTVTSSNEMCLDTVEWIMEDITFSEDDEGLASFTTLTFSDAAWITDAGTYSASNANEHYEITDRTSTSVSGEKVVIEYV